MNNALTVSLSRAWKVPWDIWLIEGGELTSYLAVRVFTSSTLSGLVSHCQHTPTVIQTRPKRSKLATERLPKNVPNTGRCSTGDSQSILAVAFLLPPPLHPLWFRQFRRILLPPAPGVLGLPQSWWLAGLPLSRNRWLLAGFPLAGRTAGRPRPVKLSRQPLLTTETRAQNTFVLFCIYHLADNVIRCWLEVIPRYSDCI